MLDLTSLLVQIISGLWGGSLASELFKAHGLGRLGNMVAGSVGGVLGGQMVASALKSSGVMSSPGVDPGSLVSQFAGGGLGGLLLVIAVVFLRRRYG